MRLPYFIERNSRVIKGLIGLGWFSVLTIGVIVGRELVLENQETRSRADLGTTIPYTAFLNNTGISSINTAAWGEQHEFAATVYEESCCGDGVYVIRNESISDARNDRYSVLFDKHLEPVYGLGRVVYQDEAAVADFLDENFSAGHNSFEDDDEFNSDIYRMKTPVLVSPQENLLIAYLQPEVVVARLSRSGENTEIVFKKHHEYNVGSVADLLVVKGSSVEDVYRKYYRFLNTRFFFKKPHHNAFGVYWETFDEMGCSPTLAGVQSVIDGYRNRGIQPSVITIGSGYWQSVDNAGCGNQVQYQSFTTDSFALNSSFSGLIQYIQSLISDNIYPLIGMRFNLFVDSTSRITRPQVGQAYRFQYADMERVSELQGVLGDADIFLSNKKYYGTYPSNNVRMLHLGRNDLIENYLVKVREAYGSVKGFKEDEMLYGDQKHLDGRLSNFRADLLNSVFQVETQQTGNDTVLLGSGSWFGVSTDGQNSQGYVTNGFRYSYAGTYMVKKQIDSVLAQVFSGYPHPVVEYRSAPCNGNVISQKEGMRTLQLATFLPITMHSCDYTDMGNQGFVDTVDYYANLRMRLHKYAYDKAQDWYRTGEPSLMRPLSLVDEWKNIAEVQAMYRSPSGSTTNSPRNEFMFGNALLVRPVFRDDDNVNVYFPPGKWISLIRQSPVYQGSSMQRYQIASGIDYPVFLQEGEILIIGDFAANVADKVAASQRLNAYVYMGDRNNSEEYMFYEVDNSIGESSFEILQAERRNGRVYLKNVSTGTEVEMQLNQYGKAYYEAPLHGLRSPGAGQTALLEAGKVSLNSTIDSRVEQQITFNNTYNDPVVVAYVMTRNGGQSIDVRVKDVTSNAATLFMEEPDNQGHTSEEIAYMVAEAGRHTLADGTVLEAGVHTTTSVHRGPSGFRGEYVYFVQSFSQSPVLIHTLNSYNNGAFMSSVSSHVTDRNFRIQQEAAGTNSPAASERIGWVAIESGRSGQLGAVSFITGRGSDGGADGVDNNPHRVPLTFDSEPIVLMDGYSGNGGDGYWARAASNPTGSLAEVYAEEDQVGDDERAHTNEGFSWVAFEDGFSL